MGERPFRNRGGEWCGRPKQLPPSGKHTLEEEGSCEGWSGRSYAWRALVSAMTRRDTIFKLAKGMRGRAKNCFRIARTRVEKGLQHAYRSRRLKKREARQTWIMQVGAGAREHGLVYSKLVQGLNLAKIGLDRNMLALLARDEPLSFRAVVDECKGALEQNGTPWPVPRKHREQLIEPFIPFAEDAAPGAQAQARSTCSAVASEVAFGKGANEAFAEAFAVSGEGGEPQQAQTQ